MNIDRPIVVTGATGFVGKHVITQLLDKGYRVRGTLRDTAKIDEVRRTVASVCGGAALERFELFVGDLLFDAGWDRAMQGAGAVVHVATTVFGREPKDRDLVVRPAVEGTERVFRHAHSAGIERIVMTSSIATMGYGIKYPRGVVRIDETSWTDLDGLGQSWAYSEGKTRAERFAWDFARRHGLALTTIHPGMILGPALDADASVSLGFVEMCLNGKSRALPPAGFCVVDVRDVAEMHVAALEKPESAGHRYLSTGRYRTFLECAAILKEHFPNANVPSRAAPRWIMKFLGNFDGTIRQVAADIDVIRHFDGARGAQLMGHDYRSAEEALVSAAESLIECGTLDPGIAG